ncbi:tetratricopeptide repeat protein [Nitratidesulfovibrio sp.]|uniref:tetratricopeptide repeat protein n=1 Tax=Nitratidesulfovibrio sp. TaxID=2802297 RepID=UPI00334188F5
MSENTIRKGLPRAQQQPEIPQPLQGEVSGEAAPLLRFVLDNARTIAAGLGVLVLAAGAGAGYRWWDAEKTREAQTELGMLTVAKTGADRVQALEAFLAKAPSGVRNAVLLDLAAAAMELKDYDKAASAWERLAAAEGATGVVARIGRAQALSQAGKDAEALAVLEGLENSVSEISRNAVRGQLAVVAERAGKLDRAVAAYEQLMASESAGNKDYFKSRAATLKARMQKGGA